ncbi:MAG: glycosyltransferase family 4 protein [Verrucomicrobia bacterium]|jgi:glycosyltransferase involved in cell wall biosynthesis|nr:glycosyltransferase family 4 protein [Verrucomicrobiota bacterium]
MNICVFTDFRFVTYPALTGVGKHIIQMVQGLSRINGNKVTALAAHDQIRNFGPLSFAQVHELPLPWKLAEAVWTATGHPVADRWCGNPDWVYCPKNDYIPIRNVRVAVTIHGAHQLDPHMPRSRGLAGYLNRMRSRTSYTRALRQADLVLTVSKFLKAQVVDWFNVEPEKICVVGNGVESEFFRVAQASRGCSGEPPDRPFVLCVGGLNYLDGGDRMVEVASLLNKQARDLRVLVAGCQHSDQLKAKAAQLPNLVLLGYLESERLAHYMRDAVALLFPTRYETFGIAAAEAMAAGTPVITCRSTAVPEIVRDAGLYVSPDSPEEAVEAIRELMANSGLAAEYIQRGHDRAGQYTWAACVRKLNGALLKGGGR